MRQAYISQVESVHLIHKLNIMCKIVTTESKPGHIEVTCEISGKPITSTNAYGMHCEDKCYLKTLDEDIEKLEGFLGSLDHLLEI